MRAAELRAFQQEDGFPEALLEALPLRGVRAGLREGGVPRVLVQLLLPRAPRMAQASEGGADGGVVPCREGDHLLVHHRGAGGAARPVRRPAYIERHDVLPRLEGPQLPRLDALLRRGVRILRRRSLRHLLPLSQPVARRGGHARGFCRAFQDRPLRSPTEIDEDGGQEGRASR